MIKSIYNAQFVSDKAKKYYIRKDKKDGVLCANSLSEITEALEAGKNISALVQLDGNNYERRFNIAKKSDAIVCTGSIEKLEYENQFVYRVETQNSIYRIII